MKSIEHSQSQSSTKAKKKHKLRKSAISPATPTLQEPAAKALPTSNKVKINAKFSKLVASVDKERSLTDKNRVQVTTNTLSKKNLFQKKSMPASTMAAKCLSPPNKTPQIRRASLSSNTSSQAKFLAFQDQTIGTEGETKA